jgi:hypothetical protein
MSLAGSEVSSDGRRSDGQVFKRLKGVAFHHHGKRLTKDCLTLDNYYWAKRIVE